MEPPCISISFLLIDSPSPVPAMAACTARLTCINSSKIFEIFSCFIPKPVSLTEQVNLLLFISTDIVTNPF